MANSPVAAPPASKLSSSHKKAQRRVSHKKAQKAQNDEGVWRGTIQIHNVLFVPFCG
jgi:hypothetical protein